MVYTYNYDTLKHKYQNFSYPLVQVLIEGKNFSENKEGFLLSDLQVELTSGFEASAATFQLYGCFDPQQRQYKSDQLRQYISLGYCVLVRIGYGSELSEVFKGFIAQVSFSSIQGDPHHVTVTAMDIKGMMMANCYARQMSAKCYSDAVTEIFSQSAYQQMNSQGIYDKLWIEDTPDKPSSSQGDRRAETIEMVSESDYEFTVRAARHFNFEFFVENGVVMFRKSKSVKDCLMQIGVNSGLLSYDLSYDITGLVQMVEARGMDTGRGSVISATCKLKNKLSLKNRAKSLISQTKRVYVDATITSQEQAQYRAESILEDMSFRLGLLEAECVGIPEIKPGNYIELHELCAPADNRFYLTNVTHCISDTGGYRTKITGKASSITI